MKELYHGSIDVVKTPDIRQSNRTLDFGFGFYLTSSERQAADWVKRRLSEHSCHTGYINCFEFEETVPGLKIKRFDGPTEEWLDFVMANRRTPGYEHDYDVVIGPVANDRVYTAFSLFEGGIITKSVLIAELKTYRLVDQWLFHTSKALSFLKFKNAKIIEK